MKKVCFIIMGLIIAAPAPSVAGSGWLLEGDVCSAAYLYNPNYQDDCSSGLTCVALVPGNSSSSSGVCCADNAATGNWSTSQNWHTVNSIYQVQTEQREACAGYYQTRTSYRCVANYYGTPTGTNGGCTLCPANSTCAAGSATFTCNKGYYKNGSGCSSCPVGGTTASVGATSISQCCLPSVTSGTAFSDNTGKGNYTGPCCEN